VNLIYFLPCKSSCHKNFCIFSTKFKLEQISSFLLSCRGYM